MIHLLIGIIAMGAFWFLVNYAQKKSLHLNWWEWLFTILCIVYTIFVLEVIVGFLDEQEPKAALIMGASTGIFAVVWAVLLSRFVFSKNQTLKKKEASHEK